MAKKLKFYDRFGVEEYYIYDPDRIDLTGWQRVQGQLEVIEEVDHWTSPRLGIRFVLQAESLEIYRPDGQRFLTYVELGEQAEQEHQRAEQEHQRAEQERQRAETALTELELERQRYQALLERLQAQGIDPGDL